MPQFPCPHCSAANLPGVSYCTSCGKALPASVVSGPRVVSAEDPPATPIARSLITGQLQQQMRKAMWAILAVAIIQTIAGPAQLLMLKAQMEHNHPGRIYFINPRGYLIVFGIAAAFWAMFIWARKSPLPAAIVGLVMYITLQLVDAVFDPTTLARGWLLKGIVIVVLARAIDAGIKARKLEPQNA